MEHQLNVHLFLLKLKHDLKDGGLLVLTVPPYNTNRSKIVDGHLTAWNSGFLIYNLVVAGFDCSDIKIKQYDYNISVILRKEEIQVPELAYGSGDMEKLKPYAPDFFVSGYSANLKEYNWEDL